MTRTVNRLGYIFQFPTSEGRHGYCQWLPHDVRFFLISTGESLGLETILRLPVAFRIVVFKDTPSRYGWAKIGAAPVPPEYGQPQAYAKQDVITKKITIYRGEGASRDERPASYDEVRHLETCAVWAHPHIVERLLAGISGVPSKFLESLRVKPPVQGAEPDGAVNGRPPVLSETNRTSSVAGSVADPAR